VLKATTEYEVVGQGLESSRLSSAGARALCWLTVTRCKERIRRLAQRVVSPRRLVLTCLALGLVILWLGQILVAAFLRPPAGPTRVAEYFASGLSAYLLWHFLRSVWQPPEHPIAWSNGEREWLLTAPLTRWQLLLYRLHTAAMSAAGKAGIATLLLWPDLPQPALGFVALCGGLLALELVRMVVEICISQASPKTRWHCLVVVSSLAGSLAFVFFTGAYRTFDGSEGGLRGLLNATRGGLSLLSQSPAVHLARSWFEPWSRMASGEAFTGDVALALLAGAVQLVGLIIAVRVADMWFVRSGRIRARRLGRNVTTKTVHQQQQRERWLAVQMPWRMRAAGVAPLVWRQFLWLRQYWLATVGAMAVPCALCALPLWVMPENVKPLPFIVGNLAFYTLLLSPAALKSDFRRDLDRLVFLKSLPMPPLRVVTGQVLTPLLVSMFAHSVVLLLAWLFDAAHFYQVLVALLCLLPFSVMAFAAENAAFLCFPYRMHQEGFEILVRTTLAFTAKGFLFSIMIGAVWLWAQAVARLDGSPTLFIGGIVAGMSLCAAVSVWLCKIAFERFDPSCDLPAA